jgi:arsenite methyltransferase
MAPLVMRIFDVVFGHPRGPLGRVGGELMACGNARQEHRAVDLAEVTAGQSVLVVGHGPGVGVRAAASAVGASGHVVGVDPSATMRAMAANRCAALIATGRVELRAGSAEDTGCPATSVDAAISVNNVMLWDRPAGLVELGRVLRPGGRLVVTVHRHVLGCRPEQLRDEATAAGFVSVAVQIRRQPRNSSKVELTGRTPAG